MISTRLLSPSVMALLFLAVFFHSLDTSGQQPLPAEGNEATLLEVLRSDGELFDKAKACQRLAIIGTADSVPVLAGLLGDESLAHYARFGLESNPSPKVDKAFRESLDNLTGKQRVGVINSIGVRRDPLAVEPLITLTKHEDVDVAEAAISALGAIATPEAVAAIKVSLSSDHARLSVAAADAALAAADRLLIDNNATEAAAIFAAIREADLPKHINVASRFGTIRAGEGDIQQQMNEYLASEDRDLFQIGLELAHQLPGEETTQHLLKKLESLATERRALLIYVLGSRGDAAAVPAVMKAAESGEPQLRMAALNVLGALGDQAALPVLLQAAASPDESIRNAARHSLTQLADPNVDSLLVAELETQTGPAQLALIDVIGRRGISEAMSTLLNLMADANHDVRDAAIEALGMTVGSEEFPQLVDQLIAANRGTTTAANAGPLKDALQKACQRMPDRDSAATVLFDRMNDASPATKAELLDLMIYVGGEKALQGIAAAAKGSDDALADAATQALGKWLTPDVAPVLLELAQSGNEKYRIRCLRGYIRVIRQFGLRPGERLQMSKLAMKTATRDEERQLILDTLTRFPTPASLAMVEPYLGNPSLQEAASQAAIMIGEKIVTTHPKEVAAVMPRALAATGDDDFVSRAKVLIQRSADN